MKSHRALFSVGRWFVGILVATVAASAQTPQTITFPAPLNPTVSTVPVTLTATASSGLPVSYSVLPANAATIAGSTITFTTAGPLTIRATQAGNATFSAAAPVDRLVTVARSTPLITWPTPASVPAGTLLSGAQLNATANVSGTFDYNPPAGTPVSQPSRLLSVTFTPAASIAANYTTVTASVTLAVVSVPEVTGQLSVSVGTSVPFSINGSYGRPPYRYQWLRDDVPVPGATNATFNTPPVTRADNQKSYSVRITDAANVTVVAVAAILEVNKGTQTITFNAPTNPVVSPTAILLGATSSVGLPVTYSIQSGNATVSGANLTLSSVGTVTIQAAQPGNDDYLAATSVSRTFTVGKGTPVLTWTPAPLTDGSTLGPPQLNAAANVMGSYAYTPGTGATVRLPSQSISVVFTPNDQVNYNNANAQRTVTVNPAVAADPARLTNVSVRASLAAAQTLIVGFAVQGGTKNVLVRAIGPTLASFGVGQPLTDPRVTLFRGMVAVQNNDNWGGTAALSTAFNAVGAFALPAASLDAALLASIEGAHTVQVTGTGAGAILAEIYDAGTGASPRLVNVSSRNRVGTGADILIAGITVGGTGERTLLIRGVGPTLQSFGVTGFLVDPKLEVFSGSVRIAENDTWAPALAATFASAGAFALTPDSRDAALTLRLAAGSYTVQVSGADGGTGEGLVEVYELP